ncbi:MAG: hypothetical protein B6245_01050 [Desulfobacteraceae bacterium 4572_88]|nr:MAG: hypothetical protein B6245_01050 [Desulfobacteraceae bacterium 4572_88]
MPTFGKQSNKKIETGLIVFFITSFFCVVNSSFAEKRETPVVIAVGKVGPAVVNIATEYEVRSRAHPFSGMGNPFFDSFFRDFFDRGVEPRHKKNSLGSGVIIDGKKGLILTNAHVIERTGTITVVLKDEREFQARIVGADSDSDLAVLRISSRDSLPAVEMGDSDDLMIGETVIAIGNPFGFSHTVTTGVVSATGRSIRTEDRVYHNFIQTDASINPGNSGGPLLNINGELIGINTAIYAKARGIGFAIPISKAKGIISDLLRYGEVSEAWVGLAVQDIDARLSRYLRIPPGKGGVLVRKVEKGSPARRADIREGDIVLSLGGIPLSSGRDYDAAIKNFRAGDTVKMGIWREDRKISVSVKTAIFPPGRAPALGYDLLGIKVGDMRGGTEGVVISEIRPDSHLADIGVRPGDIIRQMDEMTIGNMDDFEKAIVKYRNKTSLVILLQRGERGYYITVRL